MEETMPKRDSITIRMNVESYTDFKEPFVQTEYYLMKARGHKFGSTADLTLQVRTNSDYVPFINDLCENEELEIVIRRRE